MFFRISFVLKDTSCNLVS